ncbi:hypothetical protein AB0J14_04810 [Micromonospora arborensis]|uniref:hypothetical protein n=1 Tax=Micromonospora arborensis TaxID=2116518 RepID=UPI003408B77C
MDNLPDLATRLTATTHDTNPLRRYQALRDLAPQLKAAIAAAQDEAIAEARNTTPEPEVAETAGVTVHEVRRRITAHRKRSDPPPGRGRPPRPTSD